MPNFFDDTQKHMSKKEKKKRTKEAKESLKSGKGIGAESPVPAALKPKPAGK